MKKIIIFSFILIANLFFAKAQNFPEKPSNYVTDDALLLSNSEQNELNLKLKNLEEKSTNQVFIYVAKSLNGYNLEDITQKIFDKWEIGKKGKDNGVLITVFIEDRKFRIQTGYGVESLLPDITCNSIQDEYIIPNFKDQNYFDGLNQAIDAIAAALKGELTPEMAKPSEFKPSTLTIVFALIINGILLLVAYLMKPKTSREKAMKYVFIISYTLCFTLSFIVLAVFSGKMNFQLLLQSYILIGFNFLMAIITIFMVEEYAKTNNSKSTNYIFISIIVFTASIFYMMYIYQYNTTLLTNIEFDSNNGIYAFLATIANIIYMFVALLALVPSSKSSSSSSAFGGSSSTSSWSYSSGSGSSYSSSGSSFSGGGGGRSGGGGSSGSW